MDDKNTPDTSEKEYSSNNGSLLNTENVEIWKADISEFKIPLIINTEIKIDKNNHKRIKEIMITSGIRPDFELKWSGFKYYITNENKLLIHTMCNLTYDIYQKLNDKIKFELHIIYKNDINIPKYMIEVEKDNLFPKKYLE